MKLLVTGATGFIGKALLSTLAHDTKYHLYGAARRADAILPDKVNILPITDLTATTDWRAALVETEMVIHTAARVHIMHDVATNPLDEFRLVNVQGTLNLARQAAAAGVKRFLFLSSIKVNGEVTQAGQAYTADSQPMPLDPYGISKYEAEQGLLELSRQTTMEIVIIRPVLVYGPAVKANFLNMMRWLHKGLPLPLGALDSNRRSMVALDNLIDLIITCIDHPAAANQIFLVSDGQDLSTTELLRRTAAAMDKSARLFNMPPSVLQALAKLVGKPHIAQRLCDSLQVDIGKTRDMLDWFPPIDIDTALRLTTRDFLDRHL